MTCGTCGEPFTPRKSTSKYCSRRCANTGISRASADVRSRQQRGRGQGRTYRKYLGRHEHRVVAEQMLGRPLQPGEIVHHRNGDKRDNRPENLQVLRNQAEHARIHALEGPEARGCAIDGCDRDHYGRGLCSLHYQRAVARTKGVQPRSPRRICTTAGCGRPQNARGLCSTHYSQARREGVMP